MFLVVAVDRNWAISEDNSLVYRIPVIAAQFREYFRGKTIVYNPKSLGSFPGGQPLPECNNLIYTRDMSYACAGATIIHSINELNDYSSNEVFIIGGANIYKLSYSKCKYAFVAYVDSNSVGCKAFFPDLSTKKNWQKIDCTSNFSYHEIPYRFETYINRNVD